MLHRRPERAGGTNAKVAWITTGGEDPGESLSLAQRILVQQLSLSVSPAQAGVQRLFYRFGRQPNPQFQRVVALHRCRSGLNPHRSLRTETGNTAELGG